MAPDQAKLTTFSAFRFLLSVRTHGIGLCAWRKTQRRVRKTHDGKLKTVLVCMLSLAGMAAVQSPALRTPTRIVSLVPSVTEMLFAIGAGSRVVGVSSYDRQPPEVTSIPRVGGLLNPDVERIFRLRPDFVVVYATQDDVRAQLARAEISAFAYSNTDLAGVAQTMRQLGGRLGVVAQANRAAGGIERHLAWIRARVAARARPRVLVVFGREPRTLRNIDAAGGTGFNHDMLEVAGAVNVLSDVRRVAVQITTETILKLAPDAIIDLHYGDQLPSMDISAERTVWNQLPAIPAVRTGRVYLLLGDEFVVPGPRIADATEKIARALHPEAFR